MTIQVRSVAAAKSKKTLEAALNEAPGLVNFYDPSIFATSRGQFTGEDIPVGDKFAVVMDHPKRNRFALITRRLADGKFKVS
jgi:hypothetical protein